MRKQLQPLKRITFILSFLIALLFGLTGIMAQEGLGPVEVRSLVYSPDGTQIAYASGPYVCSDDLQPYAIRVIDAETSVITQTLLEHHCVVNEIDWSSDGTKLVSSGEDGLSYVWDLTSGQTISNFKESSLQFPRNGARWSPNNELVVDYPQAGSVIAIWDAQTGEAIGYIGVGTEIPIAAFDWSSDGTRIATVMSPDKLQIWDVRNISKTGNPQLLSTFENRSAISIKWSPDDRYLALGDIASLKIIEVATGQEVTVLSGHSAPVLTLAWSPDGTRLASGSMDNTARVWDITSGTELAVFRHPGFVTTVDWSPTDEKIAYSGRGADPSAPIQIVNVPPALTPATAVPAVPSIRWISILQILLLLVGLTL